MADVSIQRFSTFILKLNSSQGTKCEEWKDEKKSSATVLYTQIINSQPVYTVHGTHSAEGSAAPQMDQSHLYRKSSNNGNREIVWKIAVLYENALCSTQCVVCHGSLQNYLEPTKVNERSSIFFPRALNFQRNRILMTSCDFP